MTQQATLDALYLRVTEAIQRADALQQRRAPDARSAHREVSLLEEHIARVLPPSDPEGALARRGAVRAAVLAEDHERAHVLVERFVSADDADPHLCEQLRALLGPPPAAPSVPDHEAVARQSEGRVAPVAVGERSHGDSKRSPWAALPSRIATKLFKVARAALLALVVIGVAILDHRRVVPEFRTWWVTVGSKRRISGSSWT